MNMLWNNNQKGRAFSWLFQAMKERCGKSDKQLASILDVNQSTISRWKNLVGRPGRDKLIDLLRNIFALGYEDIDAVLWLAGLPEMTREELRSALGSDEDFRPKTEDQLQDCAAQLLLEITGETLGLPSTESELERWKLKGVHLPSQLSQLYGRDEMISSIVQKLSDPQGSRVVALCGLPGSGKTELAVAVAHQLHGKATFDQIIWRSFISMEVQSVQDTYEQAESSTRGNNIITAMCQCLACTPGQLGQELSKASYLFVLDNFEDTDDISEQLGTLYSLGRSRILITSERQIVSPSVDCVIVEGLDFDAAKALLREEAKKKDRQELVKSSEPTLRGIYYATKGLPLALHWVIGYAAYIDINRIVRELEFSSGIAEELYNILFQKLWNNLSPTERSTVIYFDSTSIAPISYEEVANACATNEGHVSTILVNLLLWNLIILSQIEGDEKVYELHSLTRQYLRGKSRDEWVAERDKFELTAIEYRLEWLRHKVEAWVTKRQLSERRFDLSIIYNCIQSMQQSAMSWSSWTALEYWWNLEYLFGSHTILLLGDFGRLFYTTAVKACDFILGTSKTRVREKTGADHLRALILQAWGVSEFDVEAFDEGDEKLQDAQDAFTRLGNWRQVREIVSQRFHGYPSNSRQIMLLRQVEDILETIKVQHPQKKRSDILNEVGKIISVNPPEMYHLFPLYLMKPREDSVKAMVRLKEELQGRVHPSQFGWSKDPKRKERLIERSRELLTRRIELIEMTQHKY